MTRTKNPEKLEYAYLLFMQGVQQEVICERVCISAPTLRKWKEDGSWEEKRAARTISLDDLLAKSLQRISELLESKETFNADTFAKAVKQLKDLKSGSTVDDDINTFMGFQEFLIQQRSHHKDITDEFIKQLTRFQDMYVQYRLGSGKLPRK